MIGHAFITEYAPLNQRVSGSSPEWVTVAPAGEPAGAVCFNGHAMPASIVIWTFAPDWLTPAQAAQLLGPAYTEAVILALIEQMAIVAEDDLAGGWLVEKRSLHEFLEALWEVSNDDD